MPSILKYYQNVRKIQDHWCHGLLIWHGMTAVMTEFKAPTAS